MLCLGRVQYFSNVRMCGNQAEFGSSSHHVMSPGIIRAWWMQLSAPLTLIHHHAERRRRVCMFDSMSGQPSAIA